MQKCYQAKARTAQGQTTERNLRNCSRNRGLPEVPDGFSKRGTTKQTRDNRLHPNCLPKAQRCALEVT
jgi:hypothetical protein